MKATKIFSQYELVSSIRQTRKDWENKLISWILNGHDVSQSKDFGIGGHSFHYRVGLGKSEVNRFIVYNQRLKSEPFNKLTKEATENINKLQKELINKLEPHTIEVDPTVCFGAVKALYEHHSNNNSGSFNPGINITPDNPQALRSALFLLKEQGYMDSLTWLNQFYPSEVYDNPDALSRRIYSTRIHVQDNYLAWQMANLNNTKSFIFQTPASKKEQETKVIEEGIEKLKMLQEELIKKITNIELDKDECLKAVKALYDDQGPGCLVSLSPDNPEDLYSALVLLNDTRYEDSLIWLKKNLPLNKLSP